LEPVIPSEKEFPYTIRVVSEITSSNGSTSMASVCGSSLSLMDAGVPIKKPVAGIAMGLIAKTDKNNKITDYKILTDILGLEDHLGDMDFKVAGTKDGINAMQMDVKTRGITAQLLEKGLKQAKEARLFILDKMKKTLPAARAKVSRYAPKIQVIHIDPEKIGDVIGPGGKMIRQIINQTGVAMDVDDDGKVTIASKDPSGLNKAIEWVKGLTKEVKPGEMYEGEVKRILNFGAFVEILPGKQGLVHISKLKHGYVKHPSDVVSEGDKVKVKVEEIDSMGRINLTMLFGKKPQKKDHNPSQPYRFEKKY
jgi:polyribonucleotide nucleotidyltransferase